MNNAQRDPMPVTIAGEALNACSGCEISFLDMGEKMLTLLEKVRIVHLPLLMDSKHSGITGKDQSFDIPKADIGLVSGSIKNREHLALARAMRESCKMIVALGTCATHGGIPAMINSYETMSVEDEFLSGDSTDAGEPFPSELVPKLLGSCRAVDEVIKVDYFLPGCPPHPDHMFNLLTALEKGEDYVLPELSVCDNCTAKREGKGSVSVMQRPLALADREKIGEEETQGRCNCFLEQGFLCMGPVTINGCGGDNETARCIAAGMPCRGCYGPMKHRGNQRLAMLNALVSNGIDIDSLPETVSLLRFSGGHGLLRPALKKGE